MDHLSSGQVLDAEKLAQTLEKLRNNGKKIVHTSGVFDVLHPGHLDYLKAAKALGDVLVVSINSDLSTKAIKGPNRPYNSQQDRAQMLAGLRWVDYVTYFDEETPVEIVNTLKPNVHVKGGDYDSEQMPETAAVKSCGGEVVVIPLTPNYSTTRFINNVLRANEAEDKFVRPEHVTTRK